MNESIADAWNSLHSFYTRIEHLCSIENPFSQSGANWRFTVMFLLMTVCKKFMFSFFFLFKRGAYIKRCYTLARIKQLIKHLSVSNQWWINSKWIATQVATNANEFKFSHSIDATERARIYTRTHARNENMHAWLVHTYMSTKSVMKVSLM